MSAGVYKIEHIHSGKVYVGSAVNIAERWYRHRLHLSRNKHHSAKLLRAWKKYGSHAFLFQILEYVDDLNLLIEREQHWLDTLQSVRNGYNICPTAGNTLGTTHSPDIRAKIRKARALQTYSPETRAKLRAAKLGSKQHPSSIERTARAHRGKIVSLETRQKLSKANKGRVPTAEQIARLKAGRNTDAANAKIRASRAGFRHTEETKQRLRFASTGRRPSPETRVKLSAWQIGRKHSPEAKQKMSAARTAYYARRRVKV